MLFLKIIKNGKEKEKITVAPLYQLTDVYDIPKSEFEKTYQKLSDYILSTNLHKTENENKEF